jgi:hypothetical protein
MVMLQHFLILAIIIRFIINPFKFLLVTMLELQLNKGLHLLIIFSKAIKMVFHINNLILQKYHNIEDFFFYGK